MFGDPDNNNGQPQTQDTQTLAPGTPTTNTGQPAPGAPPAPTEPNNAADYSGGQPTVSAPSTVNAGAPDTNELLNIKQQALQELSPLVGHLEQSPEEEFRTTMMMIQASDNQALIQKAYESAQKIEDEKKRARALLDVVNEINYFTQHHDSEDAQPSNEDDENK